MPDGLVLGARGPYGILVKDRDSALNQWFINTYKNLYGTFPSGPAYQYGQAILAAKIAYDKAGSDATDEELAAALKESRLNRSRQPLKWHLVAVIKPLQKTVMASPSTTKQMARTSLQTSSSIQQHA